MRRRLSFNSDGALLAASLDEAPSETGLIIVSGGNEIRAGAHAGQAALAATIAAQGHPVFRFDAPGIGDSEGTNGGFSTRGPALQDAIVEFRRQCPHVRRIVLFGNCDAASLILLSGAEADRLLLANPWVIEQAEDPGAEDSTPVAPPAAAIRARYLSRLKNPGRLVKDLLSGRIDLAKLAKGLGRLTRREAPSGLAGRMGTALAATTVPVDLLIAKRDTTALAFLAAWRSPAFTAARDKAQVHEIDSASHGFADADSRLWLEGRILSALAQETEKRH